MRALGLVGVLAVVGCTHTEVKEEPKVTATDEPAKPTLLAGLLIPPEKAGDFRSSVTGCAATPEKEPEQTRAMMPAESVVATGMATGIVLTHEVPHACCLSAKTTVDVVAEKVTVTDAFDGKVCRCRCNSTIRTAVAVPKGKYTVEVKTVEPSGSRSAWTGEVAVQ